MKNFNLREALAGVVMLIWTALGIYLMNLFGFQNHTHDILWSIGAAIAVIFIILINVYIYFWICKDTVWVWK
ncbi:MAG: hypothetical protein VX544_05220 [Pseudomonadota bacterium]|nr:hypothetical protein [Pseudomonadota bacterium]